MWFNVENPSPFPFLLLFNFMFVPNMNEHGIYWNINYLIIALWSIYYSCILYIHSFFFWPHWSCWDPTFRIPSDKKHPWVYGILWPGKLGALTIEIELNPTEKNTLWRLWHGEFTWPCQRRIVISKYLISKVTNWITWHNFFGGMFFFRT